jgi:acetyltransferase-like isoleucine patch superfamily enzyme
MTHAPPATPDSLSPTDSLRLATAMPWKALNEVERLLLLPLAHLQAAIAGVQWGPGWKFYGLPILQKHRRSTWRIGARLNLRSTARSNPLGPHRPCILSTRTAAALLEIGDDLGMTGGSIVAAQHIRIGHRVLIGANTIITDTDFHPLDPLERQRDPQRGAAKPVVIEDDVFIGMQCLILKGVHLGAGCVIGAGSVVSRDVPAGMIAAGNPARVIRPVV